MKQLKSDSWFGKGLSVLACLTVLLIGQPGYAQEQSASTADGAPAAVSDSDLATARLHFGNGVDLISESQPNYQDGYQQFLLAYEKSGGSWKVLGNLGLCALKLERDGEALSYYKEYLEKGKDEVDPEERKNIEKEVLIIEGSLTSVQIESSDPTARITVQRQGSTAPAQIYTLTDGKADLMLRSGQLMVKARAGGKELLWQPVLSSGDHVSYVFDFSDPPTVVAPVAATKATSGPDTNAQHSGKSSALQTTGYITAGVGLLAVVGGAVTGVISQSKEKKAVDSCINQVCLEATEGDFDKAKQLSTVANVLFISGGVLAATGVTLVIVAGSKGRERSPSASLNLSPGVALGGGALFASGTF